MNTDVETNLLAELEYLLEKQIKLALKSDYKGVETLAEQAGGFLKKIIKMKPSDIPDFKKRRDNLLELYKKLELILATEKSIVKKQQQQANNVRKIISVYRNNL